MPLHRSVNAVVAEACCVHSAIPAASRDRRLPAKRPDRMLCVLDTPRTHPSTTCRGGNALGSKDALWRSDFHCGGCKRCIWAAAVDCVREHCIEEALVVEKGLVERNGGAAVDD